MVDFHDDHAYEKAPSSDDGEAGEENEGFLSHNRNPLYSPTSSSFKIAMIVSLVWSTLLNLSCLGFIFYQYVHRGPSNPIFPESIYCESLLYLGSSSTFYFLPITCLSRSVLYFPIKIMYFTCTPSDNFTISTGSRRDPLQVTALYEWLRKSKNQIHGKLDCC
jgi:hypothetical protein